MTGTQQPYTVAQCVDLFYLDNAARALAPRTQGYYRERLDRFLRWLAEQNVTAVSDLDAPIIRRYLLHLQTRNLSPYTVHAAARCIKTLGLFLVREGILDVSPMRRVKMPKLPQDLLPPFSQADVRALVDACDDSANPDRDRALLLVLLDSGVRASEFCALNVGDVDPDTGAVRVRKGKGAKDRITFIGARTRKALLRYLLTRPQAGPAEPLFVGLREGVRLHYWGLRSLLERIGNRAGVDDCDAHRFRRTFAVESLRAGMPIMQLAAMMGHGSLPVLQRYLRLIADDLQTAHQEHGPVNRLLEKGRAK
jgi:site-specific recombinase XerD